ncbi:MAG: PD-(D/E)XK nuclease family protein [Collinsella sp.]|nr:PD-(D/E)XK nuclease family protein [Collinsella sp.]
MNNNEPKDILISVLFSGTYLDEGNNIGHEIINFFPDDNGNRYLYIPSKGTIAKSHDLKSVAIILAHKDGEQKVEVDALARSLASVDENEVSTITFNGKPLSALFGENTHRGENDKEAGLNLACRVDEFLLPASGRRIFIATGNEDVLKDDERIEVYVGDVKILNQSQRTYFSEAKRKEGYRKLRDLIDDEGLWKEASKTAFAAEKLQKNEMLAEDQTPTFLEIAKKQYDELVFSNLFAYYFNYSDEGFREFAKEVLGLPNVGSITSLVRESENNIDLWIETETHVIVIENKIRSGINGIKRGEDEETNQLEKYYEYAEKKCREGQKLALYLFAPNYSSIKPSDLKGIDPKRNTEWEYVLITYKEIYNFFSKHATLYKDECHFSDFCRDLKRHIETSEDNKRRVMHARFAQMLGNADQSRISPTSND